MSEQKMHFLKWPYPFLGTLIGEYEPFQYLLYKHSTRHITIITPSYLKNLYHFQEWDLINFYLSFRKDSNFYNQGRVTSVVWNEELRAQLCEIELLEINQKKSTVCLEIDENLKRSWNLEERAQDFLVKKIKESFLIKRGIGIYFQHFVPYFSRITGYSRKSYPWIKQYLLDDINKRIRSHIQQFESLTINLETKIKEEDLNIINLIDLEKLREIIESEVNLDLLNLTFRSNPHIPYITAIKQLEDSLYWNYNTIVLLLAQLRTNHQKVAISGGWCED